MAQSINSDTNPMRLLGNRVTVVIGRARVQGIEAIIAMQAVRELVAS